MAKLLFENPVFERGTNLTVRRGVKWDVADHKNVQVASTKAPEETIAVVDIQTRVMSYQDLRTDDLAYEHDPECRTWDGLYKAMNEVYEDFDEMEIVTLVWFDYYPPGDAEGQGG